MIQIKYRYSKKGEFYMEEQLREREFIAYSRKLYRILRLIKTLAEEKKYDEMKVLLDELIEDT